MAKHTLKMSTMLRRGYKDTEKKIPNYKYIPAGQTVEVNGEIEARLLDLGAIGEQDAD